MRTRLAWRLPAAILTVALAMTGCASDPAPTSREAAGLGVKLPKLPAKLPEGPLDAINIALSLPSLLFGIMSCAEPQGCFGDAGAYEVQQTIKRITEQLATIKTNVATGIATTRVDIAESGYAQVEQDYNSRYGVHITAAYRAMGRMSDPASTASERQKALRSFKAEAKVMMPTTPEAAMRDYLTTVAGSGQSLSQAGLLGATWKLITAQIRQGQGDAQGKLPFYLPASSINLMSDMGSQRIIEGSQFMSILAAYAAALDPDEFATDEDRRVFTEELDSLWRRGVDGVPGAAAIAASLPRAVPAQSGVFTVLGADANNGLLVRNFGPVVDSPERTGPLQNADAGYALYPGLDPWLLSTKDRGDARRELTLSRGGAEWSYDRESGTLTTTLTDTPYAKLKDELGTLMAVHPTRLAAGEVVPFARAGAVSSDRAAWSLDESTLRISVKGRTDLCMALSSRFQPQSGGVERSYSAIGPAFGTTPSIGKTVLPRIVLRTCAPTPEQQWFFNGPVPMDGLPFWSPASLLSVSPTNGSAVTDDTYPLDFWRLLSSGDARDMFRAIAAQGMRDSLLFEKYGSPSTDAVDRALPPIVHPIAWILETQGNRSIALPNSAVDTNTRAVSDYSSTAVVLPVQDIESRSFFVRPFSNGPITSGRELLAAQDAPWISTAALLAIDVEPCTFAFIAPSGSSFTCRYKADLMRDLNAPPVRLTRNSPMRMPLTEAAPSASSSPRSTATPTPSASGSDDAAPAESDGPVSDEVASDPAEPETMESSANVP